MRILAIRFQNLNSLRGSHEVNLESGPLAEAGLFAITGPTGAGKSTILDAVTLALYARAARYGRDSAEDMMSRCAGECSAAVDFECAGGRFTAQWIQRRAKGKADGNLQPLRHELSQGGVIIEEKTRGVVQRVEELAGLDYDRFLRSALLAQGQFAAFLRAAKDDRADLLERITGSHIYSELGALTWQISAGYARETQEAAIRLEGVVLLPEEERAGIGERLAALGRELAVHEEQGVVLNAKVAAAKRAEHWRRQMDAHAQAPPPLRTKPLGGP